MALVIIFDGPEGSGVPELAAAVQKRFQIAGQPFDVVKHPSSLNAAGRLLQSVQRGEEVLAPPALLYLRMADQLDSEPLVASWLQEGRDVLMIHHAIVSAWIHETQHHSVCRQQAITQADSFIQPDLLFVLDRPDAELAAATGRTPQEANGERSRYAAFVVLHGGIFLDGRKPVEALVEEVLQHVMEARAREEHGQT